MMNIKQRRQDLAINRLRKRLKKESVTLITDPTEFFKKHSPHTAPLILMLQDIFQEYINKGELPGPLSRYYFEVKAMTGLRVRVAFVDRERLEEYTMVKDDEVLDLQLHYNMPCVKGSRRKLLDAVETGWVLQGPGLLFTQPSLVISF